MKKYFKTLLLLFVVFIGINEVKAEDYCIMSGKYKGGEIKASSSMPTSNTTCNSGEYYYKIKFEKGKQPVVYDFMDCKFLDGPGVYQWIATTDGLVKIADDFKEDDIKYLDSGKVDCASLKICQEGAVGDGAKITTNCEGKDTSKTVDTKYHGPKKGESVGNMCEESGETIKLLKQVYTLLRYLIPVLIIVLSIVDFMKVVLSGDEKVFKEAWNNFVKRIIVGVVILLVPVLIKMLINMAHINGIYKIGSGNDIFCIFS